MEDKTFELLTKMYNEMQTGFKEVRQDIVRLDDKIDDVKQDVVRPKNKMDENHKALYDGYKQSIEGINELKEGVKEIKVKVDRQDRTKGNTGRKIECIK